MIESNDFRAAAGLGRWPADPAEVAGAEESPRGRGLFRIVKGSGDVVTNIRRLAGAGAATEELLENVGGNLFDRLRLNRDYRR